MTTTAIDARPAAVDPASGIFRVQDEKLLEQGEREIHTSIGARAVAYGESR